MDLERLNDIAVSTATRLEVDDSVALGARVSERMIRFANNSVSVVNRLEEAELTLYVAKNKRRALASTLNMEPGSIRKFARDLVASLEGAPETEYARLPHKSSSFSPSPVSHDPKIATVEDELPEFAKSAIDASRAAGGKRAAGVIEAGVVSHSILTSTGTKGSDRRSSITLNIRSFAENDASGHGLSCSSSLSRFSPEAAGSAAGKGAKEMVNASEPEAGKYEVLLSPTVASNVIETLVGAASAFSVDSGTSCLIDRLQKRVASESFSLTDHGLTVGGLGGRVFDDEGSPTGSTSIIDKGILNSYLHNLTTAKRWKTSSTGNAGFVAPHPWNIEVGAGDSSFDEMVREMEHGIVLTSNWYTRFKNRRTGEFSTVPRDLAYLVEGGKVKGRVKGMRLSDDLLRLFSSAKLLSRSRDWIQWWEVDSPTLCPWILTDGVTITRAFD
jgi:PmbA protein